MGRRVAEEEDGFDRRRREVVPFGEGDEDEAEELGEEGYFSSVGEDSRCSRSGGTARDGSRVWAARTREVGVGIG